MIVLCVILINYYSWISPSIDYFFQNQFFLLLNWEDSSFLLNSDIFFFISIFYEAFSNFFMSSYFLSTYSFLDFLFTTKLTLVDSFFFDIIFHIYTFISSYNLIYFSNNFDYFFFFLSYQFDYTLLYTDFFFHLFFYTFNFKIFLNYDSFFFSFYLTYFDFLNYIRWFFIFFSFLFFFLSFFKINLIKYFYNFFFQRLFFFLISLGFENRIQIDLILLFLNFILFSWIFILITFDDIYSEVVELFHFFLIFVFLFIIIFLLYKYSLHYFSFLENSVTEGYTTSFILKQMVRDLSNTFALFLRFFLLLFRLNIYDGLDDFLDSYYIFFCDWNEDSYFDENTFYSNSFYYFKDNNEDNVFFHPNEQDWFDDLFARYYVIWGKLFLFYFFILEELFRISLALYIFYLIIFEVHSVNISYIEDSFITNKKIN